MTMKIQPATAFKSNQINPFKVPVAKYESLEQKKAQVEMALAQSVPADSYEVSTREWLFDKSVILKRNASNPSFSEVMKEAFVPMSPEQRHNEAQALKAKGVTPIDPFVIQILGDYGLKAIYDRMQTRG